MTSYKFKVKCPHCEFEQFILTQETLYPMNENVQLVTCDPEEGGCEEEFAVKWLLKPVYKTYKLVPADC